MNTLGFDIVDQHVGNQILWKVKPQAGNPSNAKKKDDLVWYLKPDGSYAGLKAHFQFTDEQFINLAHPPITNDWTAVLEEVGKPLKLKVGDNAKPDKSVKLREYYYAVMIEGENVNPTAEGTGSKNLAWAIGENPPPKVDVGG
jgi:hypothetical protein